LVLIAEDSEDTRNMYGEFLEFSGFQVLTAVDGLEVLRLTTEHSPDVIIFDMSMPRMSGWDTARRLRIEPVDLQDANYRRDRPRAHGYGSRRQGRGV